MATAVDVARCCDVFVCSAVAATIVIHFLEQKQVSGESVLDRYRIPN